MAEEREGVSVIALMRNADEVLPAFFHHLAACEIHDVHICDFRSSDGTVAIARDAGANVYRHGEVTPEALDLAVDHARGTVLWFLSPWCRPPERAGAYILASLDQPRVTGGYFPVRSRAKGIGPWISEMRLNIGAHFLRRFRWIHGMFFPREVAKRALTASQGNDRHFLEEAVRMARRGGRLYPIPRPMEIDLERWQRKGKEPLDR